MVHPVLYMQCVRAAFDEYLAVCKRHNGRVPPLIVNTHGWDTGLGLELTRTILGMVRARLLVRLVDASDVAKQAAAEAAAATIQVGEVDDDDEDGAVQAPPFKRRRTRLARCGPVSLALAATASNKTWDRSDCVLVEVPSMTAE